MDKLLDYLKDNMGDIFLNIKIIEATYEKELNHLVVKIVYRQNFDFNQSLRDSLADVIKDYLKIPNMQVVLKCKKSLLDRAPILKLVSMFFEMNFSSMQNAINVENFGVSYDDECVSIVCNIQQLFYGAATAKGLDKDLKTFMERNYFQHFDISIQMVENSNDILQDDLVEIESSNVVFDLRPITYDVEDLTEFIGEDMETVCYASKSLPANEKNISVAGKVKYLNKRTFVSKRKGSEGKEREYYNFVLIDNYGKSNCVYFPTSASLEKFEELKEDDVVIVCGDSEEFNGKINVKVKNIALCSLPDVEEVVIERKLVNDKYKYIFPEQYIDFKQESLFDLAAVNNNEFLKNNVCVVFDVETTGLEASTCEIIEFGGVKVVDGKIVETFSALIKPKVKIPSEITRITGITDEMVKDSYSVEQVLPDFYKFVDGAVLVAHNIAFDYKFIYSAGKDLGYVFDHKQIDTLALARANVKGLKNYKLKTICDHFGVSLENAHRAVHDAVATAQIFIEIVDGNYSI